MENWIRILAESMPASHQRVLVSDGETITIACCIQGDQILWLFENPNYKDINITWWRELPDLPPKVAIVE